MRATWTALLALLSFAAAAERLTPESFVLADLAARERTLAGIQAQIDLRAQGATAEELMAASAENALEVEEEFSRFCTTGAAHTAYGTQVRAAIEAWLEANPDRLDDYEALAREFEALSRTMDALRGGG